MNKSLILGETKYYRLYKPLGSSKYKLQYIVFKIGKLIIPKTVKVFNSKQEAMQFLTELGYEIVKN